MSTPQKRAQKTQPKTRWVPDAEWTDGLGRLLRPTIESLGMLAWRWRSEMPRSMLRQVLHNPSEFPERIRLRRRSDIIVPVARFLSQYGIAALPKTRSLDEGDGGSLIEPEILPLVDVLEKAPNAPSATFRLVLNFLATTPKKLCSIGVGAKPVSFPNLNRRQRAFCRLYGNSGECHPSFPSLEGWVDLWDKFCLRTSAANRAETPTMQTPFDLYWRVERTRRWAFLIWDNDEDIDTSHSVIAERQMRRPAHANRTDYHRGLLLELRLFQDTLRLFQSKSFFDNRETTPATTRETLRQMNELLGTIEEFILEGGIEETCPAISSPDPVTLVDQTISPESSPRSGRKKKTSKPIRRCPTQNAWINYYVCKGLQKNQTRAAELIRKHINSKAHQGTVSRDYDRVEEWLNAGNCMPSSFAELKDSIDELISSSKMNKKLTYLPNEIIEMRGPKDRHTPRQRKQFRSDD